MKGITMENEIQLCGRTLLEKLKIDADFITQNFIATALDETMMAKVKMIGCEVFDQMRKRASNVSPLLFFLAMVSLISAFSIPNSNGDLVKKEVLQ